MTTGQPVDRYECDHCGAKLPPPDAAGSRTCQYCGSTYAAKADPSVAGGMTFVIQSPPTMTWDPSQIASATRTASRVGCVSSIIITIVVLAAVAVPLYITFSDEDLFGGFGGFGSDGGGSGYDVQNASGAILPSEPSDLSVAVRASKYEDGATQVYVAQVGGSPLEEQWTTKLGVDAYQVPMAADADKVYALDTKRVVAFRRSDGGEVWQGSLTDELNGGCETCFLLVGDRVVVQTRDGTISAFDTADGRPAWSRTLANTSASMIAVADTIVVADGAGPESQVAVLNVSDGTERHILPVVCDNGTSRDTPSPSSVLSASPDDATFVIGFGTIPTCLQRWDVVTGTQLWSDPFESGSLFMMSDDAPVVWTPERIALGLGNELLVVDRNTGALQHRATGESEEYWPLGFTPDALVLRVTNTRGTTEYSVRALATDTWEQRWQHVLEGDPVEESPSSTVSDNEVVVATALSGTNVRIVAFAGSDQMLGVTSIDVGTGTVSPTSTLDPGASELIPSFDVMGWRGDQAVLTVAGSLVVVDAATGTIVGTW